MINNNHLELMTKHKPALALTQEISVNRPFCFAKAWQRETGILCYLTFIDTNQLII
jgi:hypothetical protein